MVTRLTSRSLLVVAASSLLTLACGSDGGGVFAQPCTDGQTRCQGDVVQACQGGLWATAVDCAAGGQVCGPTPSGGAVCEAPPAPECAFGARGCLVDSLRECLDDGWVDIEDCLVGEQTCVQLSDTAASCLDSCQEGDQRCVPADNAVETCVQGEWVASDRCDVSDRLCVASSYAAAECRRDCQDGQQRCQDNAVEHCEILWARVQDCGSDAVCVLSEAGVAACQAVECADGDARCDGALRQVCAGSLWTTDTDCAADLGADGLCRELTDGAWECAARECDGAAERCHDGVVERCGGGFWGVVEDCGDRVCTEPGADQAECRDRECEPGETRCKDDVVQGCQSGFWGDVTACDASQACSEEPGGATCLTRECAAGETRCDGDGAVEACDGGFWATDATCGGGEACRTTADGLAACVEPCVPDATRCGEGGVERCTSGEVWEADVACEGATDTCLEISCNQSPACIGGAGCAETCAGDGDCASGDCAPFYGACRPAAKKAICEPCTSDDECGLFGDACLDIVAEGQTVEQGCGRACAGDQDCPRSYFCDGGQCRSADGILQYHTCTAIKDLLDQKSCVPGADQCGLVGVNDGTCYITTCTIGCSADDDCPEGTYCEDYLGPDFCKVGSR